MKYLEIETNKTEMKYWTSYILSNRHDVLTETVCVYSGYKLECICCIVLEPYDNITTVHHIDRYYASKKIMDMGKNGLLEFLGYVEVSLGEEIQNKRQLANVENTKNPVFIKPV
jgi:hypothetical protein